MKASVNAVKNPSYLMFYLKCLLASYMMTVGMLLLLALFLYRFHLSEKVVSGAILFIYIAVCLFAGFISGRKMGTRKFLWGLLTGVLYFAVLLCVSVIMEHGTAGISGNLISVFFICAGSGMLGGMLG